MEGILPILSHIHESWTDVSTKCIKVHNNFMIKHFISFTLYCWTSLIFTDFKFTTVVQVHQLQFTLQQKKSHDPVPQSEVCFMRHKHLISTKTSENGSDQRLVVLHSTSFQSLKLGEISYKLHIFCLNWQRGRGSELIGSASDCSWLADRESLSDWLRRLPWHYRSSPVFSLVGCSSLFLFCLWKNPSCGWKRDSGRVLGDLTLNKPWNKCLLCKCVFWYLNLALLNLE